MLLNVFFDIWQVPLILAYGTRRVFPLWLQVTVMLTGQVTERIEKARVEAAATLESA